jgi:uncharacterized protein YyaL (SSP411 family)
VLNLLVLAHMTGDGDLADRAERVFKMFGARVAGGGRAVPMLLAALSVYTAGLSQIVIVGEAGAPDTRALKDAVRRRYLPGAVAVPVTPAHQHAIAGALPWIEELRMREGRATAYVCQDFACDVPTTSPEELATQLKALRVQSR